MSGYCPDCGNVICLCKELLHEQLNNSKLFHCPNFTTNDSGYVVCDLDKHKLLLEINEMVKDNLFLKRELEALRKERDEAVEVIEFYADEKGEHWAACRDDDTYESCCHMISEMSGGKRAREFLEKLKNK